MGKVTENTTLAELMGSKEAYEVLKKHGLPCVMCPFAAMEMESLRLGDVARIYEINLDKLLSDLNKVVK